MNNLDPAHITDRTAQGFIGLLFPLIGASLLLGALGASIMTYRFTQTASRAEGQVIKLNAGGAHPEIRFIPQGGNTTEFAGSGFINYALGDRVPVLYQQDAAKSKVTQTAIGTPGSLWFTPGILTWIGGGFVIAGLYQRRQGRSLP